MRDSHGDGDGDAGARALNLLGLCSGCWGTGRLDEAIAYGVETVNLMRQIGSRSGEGIALVYLGEVYQACGQTDRAIQTLEAGSLICAQTGIVAGHADAQSLLAATHCRGGRLQPARRHADIALTIAVTSATGESRRTRSTCWVRLRT